MDMITNAIILAAGKGERLLPLTEKIPKPLLSIGNERIIERQIRFLKEAKIDKITIVVGYLSEKFLYLKEEYSDIDIIVNTFYDNTNNFYSLFLARNKLHNTWIIEGDIFLVKNLFLQHDKSVYYSSSKPIVQYEWYFKYSESGKIQSIHVADRRMFPDVFTKHYCINMGISFWTHQSCNTINSLFNSLGGSPEIFDTYKNSYWDKLVLDFLDLFDVYIHIVNEKDWYEIDSVEDLDKLPKYFNKRN